MSKIIFKKIRYKDKQPSMPYTAYLEADNWNDYDFYTLFELHLFDENNNYYRIGGVKIGFYNQKNDIKDSTSINLRSEFENLDNKFFSLGADVDYYKNLMKLDKTMREDILISLNDISFNDKIYTSAKNEEVFQISLMRDKNEDQIKKMMAIHRNVLKGDLELTNYDFSFVKIKINDDKSDLINLDFEVNVGSNPPTNTHAIIGKNGVGKTTMLKNMVQSILIDIENTYFVENSFWTKNSSDRFNVINKIDNFYFSNLISISYSAFDPFTPTENHLNSSKGISYHYIGLKKTDETLKSSEELTNELTSILDEFIEDGDRKFIWYKAVKSLNADVNLLDIYFSSDNDDVNGLIKQVREKLYDMSSGHKILLLIITNLVKSLKEKSLVLIDEPESHLHPPLLSAFIRTISSLLLQFNAVAIIATHSPVVLQEIPKSCVIRLERYGEVTKVDRPRIETFAESVDTLTRDIFGLEFENSGFFKLLKKEALESEKSFQDIIKEFNHQIGEEGLFILKSLIKNRDYNEQN